MTQYRHILSHHLKGDPGSFTVDKLHGDASNRIYYRATLSDQSTYIIMQLPEGSLSASEEITNFQGKKEELPFLNVSNFLKKYNIPVPQILHYSPEDRCLLLEDLGNTSLESIALEAHEKTKIDWYKKAINLLIQFQKLPTRDPQGCYALMRSFDETLLNWEFDHFFEYGIEKRLKIKIKEEDLKILKEWSRNMSQKLTQLPQVLVHRDFQSRNLMLVNDNFKLIDFQDALLGPDVYDIVSLLRDSYVELDPKTFDTLFNYYCQQKNITPTTDFLKTFDRMTLQRKLKDTGRFVYIDQVKGNSSFLKSIPPSLRYVQTALERQKEFSPFYKCLKKYVPEWSKGAS